MHKYAYYIHDKITACLIYPNNSKYQEELIEIMRKATYILDLDICSKELFLKTNNKNVFFFQNLVGIDQNAIYFSVYASMGMFYFYIQTTQF